LASNNARLRVIPLGGLGEIGKNITVFEYQNDIIIVDCGLAFPDVGMPGVNLIIPDFSYLLRNSNRIRGLILTHGHEDHIGAVGYLLRELKTKIYATKLTLCLLENKLREHHVYDPELLNCVKTGEIFKLGSFVIEFIHTNHSIPDSVAVAISTPIGVIVHSGDFKVDYTPIQSESIDLQRFAELGRRGVLLFMCESTNIESKGYSMSERNVGNMLDRIFQDSPKQRIIIATFSSNLDRIQQIIDCSEKYKRKVTIVGRSMLNAASTAIELGYMTVQKNTLVDPSQVKKYPAERLVIITTGSQGEESSALSRMAESEHKLIEILPNDKVIISATPIPGNEKSVSKVIDGLLNLGADVVYEKLMDVHVSGHAKQEELKLLHALLKPTFFVPIHGEYRHLKQHCDMAINMGMKKSNVIILNIGDVLELDKVSASRRGKIQTGEIMVDGSLNINEVILRERKLLSDHGIMIIMFGIQKNAGQILFGPEIITRGFTCIQQDSKILDNIKKEILNAILNDLKENLVGQSNAIKVIIRDTSQMYLRKELKCSPVILPIILELES
jgi:ribonuclease J